MIYLISSIIRFAISPIAPNLALSFARKLYSWRPSDPFAIYQLAYFLLELNDYASAEELLLKLLNYQEFRSDACYSLGTVKRSQGKYEEAISWYKKSYELVRYDQNPLLSIADIYKEQNKFETALEYYRKALELAPNNPYALFEAGRLSVEIENLDESQKLLNSYLNLKPKDPEALYNLGLAYAKQQKFSEAIGLYKKALKLEADPGNVIDIKFNLAQSYIEKRELKAAKKMLEELSKGGKITKPGYSYNYLFGIIEEEENHLKKALDYYKKALEIDDEKLAAERIKIIESGKIDT